VVAVPYQVYVLTHSSLRVGLLGVVQLVPFIVFSLVAGTIADQVDRRRLLLITQALLALTSFLLVLGALEGHPPLWYLYAVAAAAAGISAVDQPTRTATMPNLVSGAQLASAVSLNFALFQLGIIAGPAVGGLVIAHVGLPVAYSIDVLTFGAALWAVFLLSPQLPIGRQPESPLTAVLAGFAFLRRTPVITSGYALDLTAMILSMPRALFPALALSVYHVGPSGLGLLYSAPGVGGVVGSMLSGFVRHLRHHRAHGNLCRGRLGPRDHALRAGHRLNLARGLLSVARRGRRCDQRHRPKHHHADAGARPPSGPAVGGLLDGRGQRPIPGGYQGGCGRECLLAAIRRRRRRPYEPRRLSRHPAGLPADLAIRCQTGGRGRARRTGFLASSHRAFTISSGSACMMEAWQILRMPLAP